MGKEVRAVSSCMLCERWFWDDRLTPIKIIQSVDSIEKELTTAKACGNCVKRMDEDIGADNSCECVE